MKTLKHRTQCLRSCITGPHTLLCPKQTWQKVHRLPRARAARPNDTAKSANLILRPKARQTCQHA
eukprot:3929417-Pyramimonas_sp.AAC.1